MSSAALGVTSPSQPVSDITPKAQSTSPKDSYVTIDYYFIATYIIVVYLLQKYNYFIIIYTDRTLIFILVYVQL